MTIHVYEKGNIFIAFEGCDFAHFALMRPLAEKAGAAIVEKVLPMAAKKKEVKFSAGLRASRGMARGYRRLV